MEEYLEQCCQAGLKEVRIIHGRGIGAQRAALTRRHSILDAVMQETHDLQPKISTGDIFRANERSRRSSASRFRAGRAPSKTPGAESAGSTRGIFDSLSASGAVSGSPQRSGST